MDPNFEPTIEEITEIAHSIENDVKNVGDVNDIIQPMPPMEELDQLKKLVNSLPREQAIQFLADLMGNNNKINPNNNSFSGITEERIKKHKLKQKLEQARHARMSKGAQKIVQQKYTDKISQTENKNKQNDKPLDEL